jgi:diaminohydroxyphosphoribosylaminopyrimidine deaminase/5-amino-6-(5-phosphoribosylamino)uracil reductase
VVLDGQLRLPVDGKLVGSAREVPLWVVTSENAPEDRARALQACGAEVLRVRTAGDGLLDLGAVLQALAGRGITRLMIEAGPIVAAAFVKADLVDEAVVFRSPTAIGPDGIDALEGLPLDAVTASTRLVTTGTDSAGADTVTYFVRPPG